ncbi:MAG: hypothetical protein AB1Z20_21050, partial [Desulfobacterales bacterium]
LVFWIVYCVTSTDTYLDMRRWMCLVDEPKSGAILWNYFLPWPLVSVHKWSFSAIAASITPWA